MLIKADIKEAYWIVLIHPLDKRLLGVQWREEVFIDKMLSFGLYLASKFFLQLQMHITHSLHYVDDYIIINYSIDKALIQRGILTSTLSSWGILLSISSWRALVLI